MIKMFIDIVHAIFRYMSARERERWEERRYASERRRIATVAIATFGCPEDWILRLASVDEIVEG